MNNIDQLKQQVIDAGLKLVEEGLVARTWGNVSLRVDNEHMLITPSGRKYEDLQPDDIVLVNINTHKYEGTIKPSSEYKLHTEIYRTRKKVNAVIHTHQMNASTLAAAHRELPPILDDMAQIIGPSVRVAPYALPSTKKIVRETVKALKGRMAAMMANHGAVCVGRDMEEAFVVCQVLEKACKAFIEAEFLGGAKGINKFEAWAMHQVYLRKYSAQTTKNK
ncbi:class II aldolase/adducin family protein [Prolixibacteraceae bacterium JC049]|nr:class II aldolase/adducin family protein [Prolixibacteraceae bacterium JC049]